MKKFLFKTILFSVVFGAVIGAISVSFCVVEDPFNVFHPLSARYKGVSLNEDYVKMRYILANPQKYNSYIVGNSRVGAIQPKRLGKNCYNMTCGGGMFAPYLFDLQTILKNDIRVDRVFLGLDSLCYTIESDFIEQPIYMPYERSVDFPVQFWGCYLDMSTIIQTLEQRVKVTEENRAEIDYRYEHLYSDGTWIYHGMKQSDYMGAAIGKDYHMEQTLDEIREYVALCEENNICLTVFTNPMFHITYEASLKEDYLLFLKELSKITPFYNFSGYNDIAMDFSYWRESSHYNADVGDMIADVLSGGKQDDVLYAQGFGWYVTEDNIDELLALPEMNRTPSRGQ